MDSLERARRVEPGVAAGSSRSSAAKVAIERIDPLAPSRGIVRNQASGPLPEFRGKLSRLRLSDRHCR